MPCPHFVTALLAAGFASTAAPADAEAVQSKLVRFKGQEYTVT